MRGWVVGESPGHEYCDRAESDGRVARTLRQGLGEQLDGAVVIGTGMRFLVVIIIIMSYLYLPSKIIGLKNKIKNTTCD